MTVEQLVAILQKMPQDAVVEIEMVHPSWNAIHPIGRVANFDEKTVRLSWIY